MQRTVKCLIMLVTLGLLVMAGTVSIAAGRHEQPGNGIHADRMWQQLHLTERQQAKAKAIANDTFQQINRVLTREQQRKLAQLREARMKHQQDARRGDRDVRPAERRGTHQGVMEELNLTARQQARIRAIQQDGMKKFRAILTKEQLKTLDSLHDKHAEHQPQHKR